MNNAFVIRINNMAGHLPIQLLKQKRFRDIEQSIITNFKNPYIAGSLKYELLDYEEAKEVKTDKIYLTNRYVGKGFVWGDTRATFEIHYDTINKKIRYIYFVA